MTTNRIPAPLIAVLAEVVSERETHATLDSLLMYAGAPGNPPEGSKHAKTLTWLRLVNQDASVDPHEVLGKLLEGYLDEDLTSMPEERAEKLAGMNDRIRETLSQANLRYIRGGHITGGTDAPSQSLEEHIRKRHVEPLTSEFDRAVESVSRNPRDALSAACNLLESLFKIYIEENQLQEPNRKDIRGLWNVVKSDLNFDPSVVEDEDLKQILSGLASVVGGVGALRTHASSAHGSGKKRYRVEQRHARLAVHASHTLALFILETWDARA